MPSAQTRPKKSAGKIEPNHISVAILQMGYRHSWTFPGRTRQSQISNSGHGLLYQVDRSKTSGNYHRKPSKKVRMGKHSVQIWSSRRNYIRQWEAILRQPFKDWCEKLCIQQHFASIKHPQTNGLVERANRSLGNGDTPFSLTYGTKAVIPAENGMPTFRTAEVDVAENDEALEINLELLKEKREQAAIREAKSKRQMEKYYKTKVRNASFKPGDLVYRSNEASRVEDTGKSGPKWEGPYEVTEALGKGSYKLKDRNGRELPQTWNVCNLKKCYIHKV
ncbi:reverse transcriptase domain-containing protein [Tanacetum coccineum]